MTALVCLTRQRSEVQVLAAHPPRSEPLASLGGTSSCWVAGNPDTDSCVVTRELLQLSGLRPRPEVRDVAERFGVLP